MFSFITHVRNQPHVLGLHLEQWRAVAKEDLCGAQFVLIDDCSDPPVSDPGDPFLRLGRSLDPMVWNYGVKNLGALAASFEWMLFTNADHVLSAPMIVRTVAFVRELQRPGTVPSWRRYFRFGRRNVGLPDESRYNTKRHIGTLLIHNDAFAAVGGYDEDFCVAYGHDDTFMQHCLQAQGFQEAIVPDIVFDNYSARTDVPDADFVDKPEWPRDLTRNDALLAQKLAAGQRYAPGPQLRFKWEGVDL